MRSLALIGCLLVCVALPAQDLAKDKKGDNLAPYVPTPQEVVDEMLKLAQVKKGDVVYDLGCGDGRIPITAAKRFGAKGVGVEYDAELAKQALGNVKKEKLEERVTILHEDAFKVDVSPASVVTLYLLPESNLKLRPVLQKKLKPGSRIVAHNFDMGDWKPERTVRVKDKEGNVHVLYLWKIEAEKK